MFLYIVWVLYGSFKGPAYVSYVRLVWHDSHETPSCTFYGGHCMGLLVRVCQFGCRYMYNNCTLYIVRLLCDRRPMWHVPVWVWLWKSGCEHHLLDRLSKTRASFDGQTVQDCNKVMAEEVASHLLNKNILFSCFLQEEVGKTKIQQWLAFNTADDQATCAGNNWLQASSCYGGENKARKNYLGHNSFFFRSNCKVFKRFSHAVVCVVNPNCSCFLLFWYKIQKLTLLKEPFHF